LSPRQSASCGNPRERYGVHADDETRVRSGAPPAGEGDQLGDAGHLHRPVTDYKDLEQTAQAVASTTSMLAVNLARLLKQPQYPLVS